MGLAPSHLIIALNLDLSNLIGGLERISAKQSGDELSSGIDHFKELIEELPSFDEADNFEMLHSQVTQWVERAGQILDDIDAALRELRRQAGIGAQSAQ